MNIIFHSSGTIKPFQDIVVNYTPDLFDTIHAHPLQTTALLLLAYTVGIIFGVIAGDLTRKGDTHGKNQRSTT